MQLGTALLVLVSLKLTLACPDACSCKWKGGKQTVECLNRNLIMIPKDIDPRTQVLDLSGNDLQQLHHRIFSRLGLTNLQKVYLNNCKIGQIDPEAFHELTNLVELDLSNNLLTAIPTRIFDDIRSLRMLNLNYNHIGRLESRAFAEIEGLVRLELSGCQIRTISPQAFNGIQALEHLRLDGNELSTIPQEAVESLRNIHEVQLHGNPWHCDCTLRPLKDWISEYKIPHPVPLVCARPQRLAGKVLDRLDVNQLACKPEIYPMNQYVESYSDDNATIVCKIRSVPEAKVFWYQDLSPLENTTFPSGSNRMLISESGVENKVSVLTIMDADERASGNYRCVAENPSGKVEQNFTLSVSLGSLHASTLSYDQVAGIILALIVLIIVILAVIVILLIKIRHNAAAKSNSMDNGGSHPIESFKGDLGTNPLEKPPRIGDTYHSPPGNGTLLIMANTYNNPDLVNEAERELSEHDIKARIMTNGHAGGTYGGLDPVVPLCSAYSRIQSDSLYPSEIWSPDENNQNFLYYHSEPLKHSTPKTWRDGFIQGSVGSLNMDPTSYGYPPDYGLPIPENGCLTAGSSQSHLTTATMSSCDRLGASPNLLSDSLPTLAQESPSRSSLKTEELSRPSPISSQAKSRVKQQGVCVLPPLPSSLKANNPDSPDEGYQEEGTEV